MNGFIDWYSGRTIISNGFSLSKIIQDDDKNSEIRIRIQVFLKKKKKNPHFFLMLQKMKKTQDFVNLFEKKRKYESFMTAINFGS